MYGAYGTQTHEGGPSDAPGCLLIVLVVALAVVAAAYFWPQREEDRCPKGACHFYAKTGNSKESWFWRDTTSYENKCSACGKVAWFSETKLVDPSQVSPFLIFLPFYGVPAAFFSFVLLRLLGIMLHAALIRTHRRASGVLPAALRPNGRWLDAMYEVLHCHEETTPASILYPANQPRPREDAR